MIHALPLFLISIGVNRAPSATTWPLIVHTARALGIGAALLIIFRSGYALLVKGKVSRWQRLLAALKIDATANLFGVILMFAIRFISGAIADKTCNLAAVALTSLVLCFVMGTALISQGQKTLYTSEDDGMRTSATFLRGPVKAAALFPLILPFTDWIVKAASTIHFQNIARNDVSSVPPAMLLGLLILTQWAWVRSIRVLWSGKKLPVGLLLMVSGGLANMSDAWAWRGVRDPLRPFGGVLDLADLYLATGAVLLGAHFKASGTGWRRLPSFIGRQWYELFFNPLPAFRGADIRVVLRQWATAIRPAGRTPRARLVAVVVALTLLYPHVVAGDMRKEIARWVAPITKTSRRERPGFPRVPVPIFRLNSDKRLKSATAKCA